MDAFRGRVWYKNGVDAFRGRVSVQPMFNQDQDVGCIILRFVQPRRRHCVVSNKNGLCVDRRRIEGERRRPTYKMA